MAQLLDTSLFSLNPLDGSIGVGWKLNFYVKGTSTPKDTYPTEADADAATNANSNPVVIDADGRLPAIWLAEDADYKCVLADENDVVKKTVAQINQPQLGGVDGSERIGFASNVTNPATRRVEDKLLEFITVADFAGATDTAKVQAAITWGIANNCPIYVDRRYTLTATVNIDIAVDTATSRFAIIGIGATAGFHCTTAITMFGSTLTAAGSPAPESEYVNWQNIRFSCSAASLLAKTHDGKLFRQSFSFCHWYQIACLSTTRYAQEWKFTQCLAIGWRGPWFSSEGAYAVVSIQSKWQFSDTGATSGVWDIGHATAGKGVVGCDFLGDEYETINGTVWTANNCLGLRVVGGYHENNNKLADFSGAGTNYGIDMSPSFVQGTAANIADTSHWEISWGTTAQAFSHIPRCIGQLHDNTGLDPAALKADGSASVSFQRDNNASISMRPQSNLYAVASTADSSTGLYPEATQLVVGMNRVSTGADWHACKMPPAVNGNIVWISNASGSADITLYPYTGDKMGGASIDASISHPKFTQRVYTCTVDGQWDLQPYYELQSTISDPSGGSTVDSEARTAIAAIIDALQSVGIVT